MDWTQFGYNGIHYDDVGFPHPGELMRQKRQELKMSQKELAELLGISSSMVARMEASGTGLDSVITRRKIAKILGIAPIMLGIVSLDDVAQGVAHLYSTIILRKTLHYHSEAYFGGASVGGIVEVQEMVQQIFEISKALGHKNAELLDILCQYTQLGASIAYEEQDYRAGAWFAKWSLNFANKLHDDNLVAGSLLNLGSALYRREDLTRAQKTLEEAMTLKQLPVSTIGAVTLDAARIYSRQGNRDAIKLLEKSTNIARRVQAWDHATIQADLGFCYIRGARIFLDLGDTANAQDQIEMADSAVPGKFMRRRSLISVLEAEIAIARGQFHDALIHADNALLLAKDLGANENLVKGHILNISNLLQASSFGTSREVKAFSNKVSLFIGDKKIKPAAC
ncbi:MAG TPA: helix-turn-helix transcriptional regulator [Ktedonosporobacter sp.]|nr:helix-turn-helix transcriptional regulator [Ktedonosporobacter sp.]